MGSLSSAYMLDGHKNQNVKSEIYQLDSDIMNDAVWSDYDNFWSDYCNGVQVLKCKLGSHLAVFPKNPLITYSAPNVVLKKNPNIILAHHLVKNIGPLARKLIKLKDGNMGIYILF